MGTVNISRLNNREVLCAILTDAKLPADDVAENLNASFYQCRSGSEIAAVIGMEVYGDVGLLRSLCVLPAFQGARLGTAMVTFVEAKAKAEGVSSLYLLTTNAVEYFNKLSYAEIDRASVPEVVKQTTQFSSICPSDAACMVKYLSLKRDS